MCYQYPRLRQGTPPLSVHQIAIRGPKSGESDREAYMSASDLHVDPCDGGGQAGSCTIHMCHPNACMTAAHESSEHLRLRGLGVFPSKTGGRGVHIHSMVPGRSGDGKKGRVNHRRGDDCGTLVWWRT